MSWQIFTDLDENVEVSWITNSDLDWQQMQQIRLGLEEKLDVSRYAKKELNWKEMKEIREELLKESTLC